jgi:hypothetical protein
MIREGQVPFSFAENDILPRVYFLLKLFPSVADEIDSRVTFLKKIFSESTDFTESKKSGVSALKSSWPYSFHLVLFAQH